MIRLCVMGCGESLEACGFSEIGGRNSKVVTLNEAKEGGVGGVKSRQQRQADD